MSKTSMKWTPLLAALLLATPVAVRESAAVEMLKISRIHWIFGLVENAKKAGSDQARHEIVGVLMSKAEEMGSGAEELEAVKQRLLEQTRIEGDSQLMRDVIMTLNILIHTKRGETFEPYKAPRAPHKPQA